MGIVAVGIDFVFCFAPVYFLVRNFSYFVIVFLHLLLQLVQLESQLSGLGLVLALLFRKLSMPSIFPRLRSRHMSSMIFSIMPKYS